MSVTIMPSGNIRFCDENGLVEKILDVCHCVDFDNRENVDCRYCNNTQVYTQEVYPFELNISNSNFSTLWNSLGLDFDYCGEVETDKVSSALNSLDENLLLRANYVEDNFYSFGIDRAQAKRYIDTLKDIVEEATKRNVKICWG